MSDSEVIITIILALLGVSSTVFGALIHIVISSRENRKVEKDISETIKRQPEEIKPIWDISHVYMRNYFVSNNRQNAIVFGVCLFFSISGFALIIFGIYTIFAFNPGIQFNTSQLDAVKTAGIVSSVSGIISQFIAATVLVIYQSTNRQAAIYIQTLQHITTFNMAYTMYGNIATDEVTLRNNTAAELAKLILQSNKPIDIADEKKDDKK